jgi:hypothetical protein
LAKSKGFYVFRAKINWQINILALQF